MKNGIYLIRPLSDGLNYYPELSEDNFQKALNISKVDEDTRARIIIVVNEKIRAVRIPGMMDWNNQDGIAPLTLADSLKAFEESKDELFTVEYEVLNHYMKLNAWKFDSSFNKGSR
jgi:hypothetical protein